MSNGKDIIHLIAGLIKKYLIQWNFLYKSGQYFSKLYELFGGDVMLKLIYIIMQQKQISKTFYMLILQVLH